MLRGFRSMLDKRLTADQLDKIGHSVSSLSTFHVEVESGQRCVSKW